MELRTVKNLSETAQAIFSTAKNSAVANVTENETWSNTTYTESVERSVTAIIVIGLILALVILLTIGGNLLVCVTIATNRKLKTYTNYFIVSLATADLLLGCIVLPFSALNTISQHWILGAAFCNAYTAMDVMLCTVSILTLFAISLDRYFAVTIPLRYAQAMTGKIVCAVSSAIWTFSFVMAFIPIHVGWNTPSGDVQNWKEPTLCLFELNKPYVLLVSLGTYFGPLAIMCGVYLKVLQITRRQVKEINKLTKAGSGLAVAMLDPSPTSSVMDHLDNGHLVTGKRVMVNGVDSNGVKGHHHHHEHRHRHKDHRMLSDTKATVTLASVILAFAICWIPYFVLFTAKPFLQTEVNLHLDLVALWFGYVNSSINPFLYAFYSSAFREGFRKILCRHCPGQERSRMELYRYPRRSPQSETKHARMSLSETEIAAIR